MVVKVLLHFTGCVQHLRSFVAIPRLSLLERWHPLSLKETHDHSCLIIRILSASCILPPWILKGVRIIGKTEKKERWTTAVSYFMLNSGFLKGLQTVTMIKGLALKAAPQQLKERNTYLFSIFSIKTHNLEVVYNLPLNSISILEIKHIGKCMPCHKYALFLHQQTQAIWNYRSI